MVSFNTGESQHTAEKISRLEDISLKEEKKISKRIEEQINLRHKHSDGSAVVLSSIAPSEIENIVGVNKNAMLSPKESIAPDYKKTETESSRGLYATDLQTASMPMFVCTCGVGFSVSGNSHGFEVYKIQDYVPIESGGYFSRPEPVFDSYVQPIKY